MRIGIAATLSPSQNARSSTAATCDVPASAIRSAARPAPSNGERTSSPTRGTFSTVAPASRSRPARLPPASSISGPAWPGQSGVVDHLAEPDREVHPHHQQHVARHLREQSRPAVRIDLHGAGFPLALTAMRSGFTIATWPSSLGSHLMALTGQLRYHPTSKWVRASYAGEPVVDADGRDAGLGAASRGPDVRRPAGGRARPARTRRDRGATDRAASRSSVRSTSGGRRKGSPSRVTRTTRSSASTRCPATVTSSSRWPGRCWPTPGGAWRSTRRTFPPRWYVPRDDVRVDLLEPGPTTTVCAYKGPRRTVPRRGRMDVAGNDEPFRRRGGGRPPVLRPGADPPGRRRSGPGVDRRNGPGAGPPGS